MRNVNAKRGVVWVLCLAAAMASGCSKKEASQPATPPAASQQSGGQSSTSPAAAPAATPVEAKAVVPSPYGLHTDDLDAMMKRRYVRALVVINPIGFFYSGGHPKGAMYEALRELETFVNQKYKTGSLPVKIVFVPVRPDQLEPALRQGAGDFIAYSVVQTPEREEVVAFTAPIQTDVKQVLVGGKDFPPVSSIDDLSGKRIYANPLSVAYQRLQAISDKLKQQGKPPIDLQASDKDLLDDDLVQMVNGGLIPATVINDSRGQLWAQVLPNIKVYPEPAISTGETTAWAVRKDNPQLKSMLDEFIPSHAVGTSFGNTLVRRYLQNTKWVKNSTTPEEMKKFQELKAWFQQYSSQYGFDYLMMVAQGYQESLLNQNAHNPSGAVGIMQVIPKYAAANPINVKDVHDARGNIEAGIKMLRNIEDQYFNDPNIDQLNKTLMVFASYNAGPNRIARLRSQAQQQGLDPNKWFGNVEILVAKDVGQETVNYVSNVYKYYIAYKLAVKDQQAVAATSK